MAGDDYLRVVWPDTGGHIADEWCWCAPAVLPLGEDDEPVVGHREGNA